MKIVGFLGIKPMLCRDVYIQVIAEAPLSNSFFSLVLMGIILDALESPFSITIVAVFLTEVIAIFKVVLGVVIARIFIIVDLVLLFLFHTLLIFKFAGFVALFFLERLQTLEQIAALHFVFAFFRHAEGLLCAGKGTDTAELKLSALETTGKTVVVGRRSVDGFVQLAGEELAAYWTIGPIGKSTLFSNELVGVGGHSGERV
jgi:hypothetical protein